MTAPNPFLLPASFTALYDAGRFDYWQAPYRSLSQKDRDNIQSRRQREVLWWGSIEWDDLTDPDAIRSFDEDDCFRPGLIPFAGNGYGNTYCWYPRWASDDGVPIVFTSYDEDESRVFACNFEECLVRCLLQHYAHWDDNEADARSQLWQAHVGLLVPHLPERLRHILEYMGDGPTPAACEAKDNVIADEVGDRPLVTLLLPTKYAEDSIRDQTALLESYAESVAFYRELVDDEGRNAFRLQLEEALANSNRVKAEANK